MTNELTRVFTSVEMASLRVGRATVRSHPLAAAAPGATARPPLGAQVPGDSRRAAAPAPAGGGAATLVTAPAPGASSWAERAGGGQEYWMWMLAQAGEPLAEG